MRSAQGGALWSPGHQVVGGRFDIEAVAGEGGSGAVFRARDRVTGALVALKALHGLHGADFGRFAREARALAALQHPNVVQYLDHGIDESGMPYLAMEWLEGEDLRTRLGREPLSPGETVALARSVTETLAAVHARGFLHRDIKPGNLFLVDRHPGSVKLLDFGLARSHTDSVSLTQTGFLVGTPGYIAPEQAQGSRTVDRRADLFSLGCVLYKCLSGKQPFEGPNLIAVMTKLIMEEPEPLAELCPHLPAELTSLVHRMLHKEPEQRPDSAATVIAELSTLALGPDDDAPRAPASIRIAGLTGRELRVAAVLLIGTGREPPVSRDAETLPSRGGEAASGERATSGPASAGAHPDLRARMLDLFVAEQKGLVHRLPDGTRVVTRAGAGTATEQAVWAARCALGLRSLVPHAPMALATGGREVSGATPMGEAIDRATVLLAGMYAAAAQAAAAGTPPPVSVAIDDATASLLDARFEVRRVDGVAHLVALRETGFVTRPLLGKTPSIVGRDWELSTISALFQECVDGPGAAAVLVTAPAGFGKSRLAQELTGRFRQTAPDVTIWVARCDSVHAGSPLHLLRLIVRAAMQLDTGGEADADDLLPRIRERARQRLPAETAERAAQLLGDLLRVPSSDDGGPGPRAARGEAIDALLKGEQIRWAWEALAAAECAAHPVVLLLDDVHWGDLPSLRFVESALSGSEGLPFMALLLARPDIHEVFPKLSMGPNFQEIRLKPLSPKAADRLVQEVLGATVSAEVRARLVARADGNAFYLEELVRALAERQGRAVRDEETLPDTVLASVQSRIGTLDDETRRLLRAASVFGEVFWASGVTALLGGPSHRSIGPWLDALVAQDLLVRRPASRFTSESELAFRHALVREAAYAMLTDEDRVLGHKLAGLWLEQHGEQDPLVLARHFERGGDPERAAELYLHAAEQALCGLDLGAAASLVDRALAAVVSADLRARALATLCHVHMWRLAWEKAATSASERQRLTARGSSAWILARTIQLSASLVFARPSVVTMEALLDLMEVEPTPQTARAHAMALGSGVLVLAMMGQFGVLEALLAKLEVVAACLAEPDLVVRGWVSLALTHALAWRDGDAWSALAHAKVAAGSFAEAGDLKNAAGSLVFAALCLLRLGAFEAADRALGEAAQHHAGETVAVMGGYYRAVAALERGAFDLAARLAEEHVASAPAADPMRPIRVAEAWLVQSEIARRQGDLARAATVLEPAIDALRPMPLSWQVAAARLARARLALGQTAGALALANEAMAAIESQGGEGYQGLLVRLARVEALDAAGQRDDARSALAAAHARLLDLAAPITDPAARARFLERVEEHARIVELAADWLDAGAP